MITLTEANFPLKAQEVIEQYYLKPMNGSKKSNLKDGHIERIIHGGMHASRATLWSLVMNQLLKKLAPVYVHSALDKIASHLKTDTQTALLLILITTTCHDSARKGEGADIWEAESAANTLEILKSLGLEDAQAQLFANAVHWKDQPTVYKKELCKLGIDEQDCNAFDYIRKLVNLGDNLDLMRCIGSFDLSYIFNTLNTIEGLDQEVHHNEVVALIKSMHQMIYDQHDMFFDSTVLDLDNKPIFSHPSSHTPAKKLQFEHAGNVFIAIVQDVIKYPEIQALVPDEFKNLKNTEDTIPAAPFDPFIHGTTSATLALISKTNFQLMPVLKMIDDFQTAPMVGELTKGGYSVLGFKSVQEEDIGATSYGNVLTGNYNLKKITANYTLFKPLASSTALQNFKNSIKYGLASGFSNFNLLLIYFTRARQMHQSLDQVITKAEIDTLNQQLQGTVQFYYFIQLLGTYIHPDFEAIKEALAQSSSLTKRDITDAAFSLLNMEQIVKKIMLHNIDMKDILLNPTEENLEKVLKVLKFPKKAVIKSGFAAVDKEIELPIAQFFSLKKPTLPKYEISEQYDEHHFGYFSRNINGYCINDCIEQFLSQRVGADYFVGLSKEAKKYVFALEDRIRVFNKLVHAPQEQFNLTVDQQALLKATYPIIFVSESSNIRPYGDEYRNSVPSRLGDDIRLIATDTISHQEHLKKYLRQHQVNPVQVVLFSDLEKASKDKSSLPLSIDSQQLRNMLTNTKAHKHGRLFYELYEMLDDLNDKRNKYRYNNPQVYKALDRLLGEINNEMSTAFPLDNPISGSAIRAFCTRNTTLIEEQKSIFEQHRGVLGILDTILTVLASLIVLYPVVYLYQKAHNIQHTFFNTDSAIKAQNTMATLSKINASADDFPEDEVVISCSA
ncbi:hypothetical protein Lmor_1058 [Legionella moravica]|uniref:SidE PDE domain-containing protein n=1 Tax=Legionella moravica TaxID=39962 RepID=A0A378JXJ5_9GAMM|nr:SidE phosphodiesterase domain-containing protein [Legionella moravica]KTD35611.1 hypothetical protein Lmor_1058 [Legionella moravica]STX62760.1 Uncharacterised protein [Legionella moravica]